MSKKYKNMYQDISVQQQEIVDQFPNCQFDLSLFNCIRYWDEHIIIYIYRDGSITSLDDRINSIQEFKKYLKLKNFK